MSKTTNHFTSAFSSVFPDCHRGSIYITQNLLRKAVEQAEWLLTQKTKDRDQLVDDAITIAGAAEAPSDGTLAICAKYGAVRGAMHYDDIALDRIDERITNIEVEIEMLQQYVTLNKQTFKDITGDTFTQKNKPQQSPVDAKRKAELMKKYAA